MSRSRSVWLAVTAPAATAFTAKGAPRATHTYSGQAPAAIRQVEIELPPGSQGTLHLQVFVVGRSGGRSPVLLMGTGGDQYVSGDDMHLRLDADFPLNTGDVVQAWYDNTDAVNPHWFAMIVTIA